MCTVWNIPLFNLHLHHYGDTCAIMCCITVLAGAQRWWFRKTYRATTVFKIWVAPGGPRALKESCSREAREMGQKERFAQNLVKTIPSNLPQAGHPEVTGTSESLCPWKNTDLSLTVDLAMILEHAQCVPTLWSELTKKQTETHLQPCPSLWEGRGHGGCRPPQAAILVFSRWHIGKKRI